MQALTVLELSTLLAGAQLLPKRGSGSLTKAGLVAIMQQALAAEAAPQAIQVTLSPGMVLVSWQEWGGAADSYPWLFTHVREDQIYVVSLTVCCMQRLT